MSAGRILYGEVRGEPVDWHFKDGLPPQPRVECSLPGGTWDIQIEWFEEAGYPAEAVVPGLKFKAETPTPRGLSPKSLRYILPPVDPAGEINV